MKHCTKGTKGSKGEAEKFRERIDDFDENESTSISDSDSEPESEESLTECNICLDNEPNRSRCRVCDFTTCMGCREKYLLTHRIARCTDCKTPLTQEEIKSVNGDYKKHITTYLVAEDKQILPLFQLCAQNKAANKDELHYKNIVETFPNGKKLKTRYLDITDDERNLWPLKTAKPLPSVCPECNNKINKCKCECEKCGVKKNSKHKCKKEDIDSMKLRLKCPDCQSYVYRIEGCNQMFCMICSTLSNWKTKKIYKNVNPHYFDTIKKVEVDKIGKLDEFTQEIHKRLLQFHESFELDEDENEVSITVQDAQEKLISKRLTFLMGETPKKEYEFELYRYYLTENYFREWLEIIQTFIIECMSKLKPAKVKTLAEYLKSDSYRSIEKLRKKINKKLLRVYNSYLTEEFLPRKFKILKDFSLE